MSAPAAEPTSDRRRWRRTRVAPSTAVGALGVGRAVRPGPHRPADHPRSRGAAAALRRRLRGRVRGAPLLRLAVLGDSTAAGYGVHTRGRDAGRAARHLDRRGHPPPGPADLPGLRRLGVGLAGAAGRDGRRGRCRPRRHLHRRQRRHHARRRVGRGAAPVRGGPDPARGRRRGRRRHLPGPRHDPADPAAAALAGPPLEPPARRRADRRHGRGRRARRSRSATCSARGSPPRRSGCSAPTGSTRRSRATGPRPRSCCRRRWPRSASDARRRRRRPRRPAPGVMRLADAAAAAAARARAPRSRPRPAHARPWPRCGAGSGGTRAPRWTAPRLHIGAVCPYPP